MDAPAGVANDTPIGLAPGVVLRCDLALPNPYSAFDVESGIRHELSPLAFLLLHVMEDASARPSAIAAALAARGVPTRGRAFHAGLARLLDAGLATTDRPVARRPTRRQVLEPLPAAVPVASTPLEMEVHFTSICNLRCRHCFVSADGEPSAAEMSAADWRGVFDQLESARVWQIVVSGGEPLVHPEARHIVEDLAQRQFATALLTNGTLIDSALAYALSAPRFSVVVSLDGATERVHDALRGDGAFARAMSGISRLGERGCRFSLSTTLHAGNTHEMEDLVRLARDCGAESVGFIALDPIGRAAENADLHLAGEQRQDALRRCQELALRSGDLIPIRYLDPRSCDPSPSSPGNSRLISCAAGTTGGAIRSDGALFPCVYAFAAPEFAVGSLLTDDLVDLWRTDRWSIFRGGLSLDSLIECRDCPEAVACTIRNCRMRALFSGRGLLGPPPGCPQQAACADREPRERR